MWRRRQWWRHIIGCQGPGRHHVVLAVLGVESWGVGASTDHVPRVSSVMGAEMMTSGNVRFLKAVSKVAEYKLDFVRNGSRSFSGFRLATFFRPGGSNPWVLRRGGRS